MTRDLDAVLANLERQLAELGSIEDVLNTPRAQDAFWGKRSLLEGRLRTIRESRATLAKVEPDIVNYEKWLDHFGRWRAELCDLLLACGRPRTPLERGQQKNFTFSIQMLDRGERVIEDSGWVLETLQLGSLMRRDGFVESAPIENQLVGQLPWPGSSKVIEQYLKQLRAQRDDAQQRLAIDAARRDEPVSV